MKLKYPATCKCNAYCRPGFEVRMERPKTDGRGQLEVTACPACDPSLSRGEVPSDRVNR